MTRAAETFAQAIQDAEHLLRHFDELNTQPPPPETEVLKRAGLIMAMTAWETYVEDRLQEAVAERLEAVNDASVVQFIKAKLTDEIKRLHNPSSEKTSTLFREYANVDLASAWSWNNYDPARAKETLNAYIKLRGDVVHRSRPLANPGPPAAHPVTRDDLRRAIRFLKDLVAATERALQQGGEKTG